MEEGKIVSEEINNELYKIVIPQCCREGWDDCPHVPKRDKQNRKKNIGL